MGDVIPEGHLTRKDSMRAPLTGYAVECEACEHRTLMDTTTLEATRQKLSAESGRCDRCRGRLWIIEYARSE